MIAQRSHVIKSVTTLAAAIAIQFAGIAVQAQFVSASPNLPPLGGVYASGPVFGTYVIGGNTYQILGLSLGSFTNSTLPPLNVGGTGTSSYNATGNGGLSVNFGAPNPFSAIGPESFSMLKTTGPNGSPLGSFDTEMLQLNLSGGALPAGMMLRESPTLPSNGQTTIVDNGDGNFKIDSFFDVFTELSIDNGDTWIPNQQSGHIQLQSNVPEPAGLTLVVAAGTSGLIVFRFRKRKPKARKQYPLSPW
ncbi:MAG: hypothetical protein ABJA67_00030 [Chthonomonadales bacterium]